MIYRVLKASDTGGLFYSKIPCFPFGNAWHDPTHINIITDEKFPLYFDNTNRWAAMDGCVAGFEIIEQKINRHHLEAILKKVPEKCSTKNYLWLVFPISTFFRLLLSS